MPDGKVRTREAFLTFDQAFIATFSSSTVRKKIKENAWSLILPFLHNSYKMYMSEKTDFERF